MDTTRTRRLLANLFVVAAAALPVLFIAGVGRGNNNAAPCPGEIAKSIACEEFSTAKCEEYTVDEDPVASCSGNRQKEVEKGLFGCGTDPDKLNACVEDQDENGKPKYGTCSKEYVCYVVSTADGPVCKRGGQIGPTKTRLLRVNLKCVFDTD